MPFTIKATFIFESRQTGWTESFFFQQSTSNLNTAMASINSVALVRKQLLGDSGSIKALRASVERDEAGNPVVGDSLLSYVGYIADSPVEEEDSNTALQVIFRSGDALKRKLLFMRGIYDSIVAVGGIYNPNANGWKTKFLAWSQILKNFGWGWIAQNRSAAATITGYTMNSAGYISFTLAAPGLFAGVTTPTRVRISRLNTRSTLNGTMIVVPTGATTCVSAKPHAAAEFVAPGVMTKYTSQFIPAAEIEDQKIVTRRAGAPLLGSRGRSKVLPKA